MLLAIPALSAPRAADPPRVKPEASAPAARFVPPGGHRRPRLLPWPADSLADSTRASTLYWPVLLDTVQVRAARPTRRERLHRASLFVTRIPIAEARAPAEGLDDLLEQSTGVTIQRYGGPGALATLSIRGADPQEVEVFLDRVPLRTASRGLVDLGGLDPSQFEAVEIYRSAPPTDLGGASAGSAVRLVTRSGGPPRASVKVGGGSFGTVELAEALSGRWQAHRYFLSLSRFRSAGDFRYLNDNATPEEASDDTWRRWTNGDLVRQTLLAKADLALPRAVTLMLASQLAQRDQGLPGSTQRPTERVRLRERQGLHRFDLASGRILPGALHGRLNGFLERGARAYRDPLRELNLLGSPREVDQTLRRSGLGFHLAWPWLAGGGAWGAHRLEVLGELEVESLTQELPADDRHEERRRRDRRLLQFGDHWETLAGHLHLSAHHRWEETRDNYTGSDPYRPFSAQPEHRVVARGPRLGLRLALGETHALKANWAHQARFPSFTELFGHTGTMRPNIDLQPEQGQRFDLGWIWTPRPLPGGVRLRLEQVLYENRLEEMIVFMRVSERETKPFNLDRARLRGYEFDLALDHLPLVRGLSLLPPLERRLRRALGDADAAVPAATGAGLTAHLTWQETRDEGLSPVYHGHQLTYHPPLQAHGRLDLVQGRWRLAYSTHYRAAAYWGRSNLPAYRTAAQTWHELSARCQCLGPRLELALRLENLFDQEREDIRGYPLPGRAWFLELTWRPLVTGASVARPYGVQAAPERPASHRAGARAAPADPATRQEEA